MLGISAVPIQEAFTRPEDGESPDGLKIAMSKVTILTLVTDKSDAMMSASPR